MMMHSELGVSIYQVTVDSTTGFPTSGTILVGSELISYTSKNATNFLGITRAASGSTRSAHADNSTVQNASDFIGWGDDVTQTNIILDPGSWSLDNFGQQLIATIKDGKTYVWDAGLTNPLDRRATLMTGAPTASRLTITSDRDRHVVHFGTETTIGDANTQDPMFIRFSDQENYNVYQPTSVNTAGTFRLDTGNKIVAAVSGKDYNLILTDQAAYPCSLLVHHLLFLLDRLVLIVGVLVNMLSFMQMVKCFGWVVQEGFLNLTEQ